MKIDLDEKLNKQQDNLEEVQSVQSDHNLVLNLPSITLEQFDQRSIDFMWKQQDSKFQKMFEEILEYGPDAMADNYMKNKPKRIKKTLHSLMEYMLINKKFMEKVNYMSSMVVACIRTRNLRESLAFIN